MTLQTTRYRCLDCQRLVKVDRLYCLSCVRRHKRQTGARREPRPEDWSARLCRLAENAAAGVELFLKTDRPNPYTDT